MSDHSLLDDVGVPLKLRLEQRKHWARRAWLSLLVCAIFAALPFLIIWKIKKSTLERWIFMDGWIFLSILWAVAGLGLIYLLYCLIKRAQIAA